MRGKRRKSVECIVDNVLQSVSIIATFSGQILGERGSAYLCGYGSLRLSPGPIVLKDAS